MKKWITTLFAFILAAGLMVAPVSAQSSADQGTTVIQKQIMINATAVSNPTTLVYRGTTYIPIYNIEDLLSRLGVRTEWTGQALDLSTRAAFPDPVPHEATGVAPGIYVNGKLVDSVTSKTFFDPKLLDSTVALPLPQMMHALRTVGLWNTWNGAVWSVLTVYGHPPDVTAHSGSDFPTGSFTFGTKAAARIQSDASYWKRADTRLYIGVSPVSKSTWSLLQIEPNQAVQVYAYIENENTNPKTTWYVNSPDAAIRVISQPTEVNGFNASVGTFVARKPGVYTIQAKTMSLFSVPMVIVVGLDQLPHHALNQTAADTGIQPLPKHLPTVSPVTVTDMTYNPYASDNGWLPVKGVTKAGTGSVVVDLSVDGSNKPFWEYQLPTTSTGQFTGMVRIPFIGHIAVRLFPNMFRNMDTTRVGGSSGETDNTPAVQYTVDNSVPTTAAQRALFATDFLDYNMNAAMVQTAETLVENSATRPTAVEAISNFAGEKVMYDWPQYLDEKYGLQLFSANGTWNLQEGTYRDVNHLAAAMLRSVGIPTQLNLGTLDPSLSTQNYTWLNSTLGSGQGLLRSDSIDYDPSLAVWSTLGVNRGMTNEYFGTGRFQDTHHTANGQLYSFYEGIY